MEETNCHQAAEVHYRVTEMGASVCGGADICEEGPLRNKQEKQQFPQQLLLQMGIAVHTGPICRWLFQQSV